MIRKAERELNTSFDFHLAQLEREIKLIERDGLDLTDEEIERLRECLEEPTP